MSLDPPTIVGVPEVKGLRIRVGDIQSPAHFWISPSFHDVEQCRTILKPLLESSARLSRLYRPDPGLTGPNDDDHDDDDEIQTGLVVAVRSQV